MCAVTIALFAARFAAQCGVFTMKTNFRRDFWFAVQFAAPQNARAVTMLPPNDLRFAAPLMFTIKAEPQVMRLYERSYSY